MKKKTIDTFRPLYRNFCVLPLEGRVAESCKNFPGYDEANGIVAYGCCIGDDGEFFLDALCCIKKNGNDYKLFPTITDTFYLILLEAVQGMEFEILGSDKDPIMDNFKDILESQGLPEKTDKKLERTRKEKALDPYRDPRFIDIVWCVINTTKNDDYEFERTFVRVLAISNNRLEAILLEEPKQNFGAHCGDTIKLFLDENEEGYVYLYGNLDEFEPEDKNDDNVDIDDVCDEDVDKDLTIDDDIEFGLEEGENLNFTENVYLGVISKDGILKVCAEPCNDMYINGYDPLKNDLFNCFNPIFEFDLGKPLDEKYYDRIYSDQGMLVGVDANEKAIYPYRKLDYSAVTGDPYIVMCDRSGAFELFDGKYIKEDKEIKKNLQNKINDFCYLLEAMYLDAMPGYTLENPIDDLNLDDNFYDELKKNYRNAKDEAFNKFEEFYKKQKICKYSESNGIKIL